MSGSFWCWDATILIHADRADRLDVLGSLVPTGSHVIIDDLVAKGRDVERRVLAEAVLTHLEDRVMLRDSTTVVFHR